MICARCGKRLEGDDDVYVVGDNWLNWDHYSHIGEDANVFCSRECFCNDWALESMTADEYINDYKGPSDSDEGLERTLKE